MPHRLTADGALGRALRVLIVEDSEDDTEAVLRVLKKHGFVPEARRVEDARTMEVELDRGPWDVVLSDCALPRFSAEEALAALRRKQLDVPFVIVSGTIAEETAASAMRAGAHDFLRKGQLDRLGPAVEREIRAGQLRSAQRRAQQDLRVSEARYRELFAHCPVPMWVYDEDTLEIVAANAAAAGHYGYGVHEMVRMGLGDLLVTTDTTAPDAERARLPQSGPWRHRTRDRGVVTVDIRTTPVEFENGRVAMMVVHDRATAVPPVSSATSMSAEPGTGPGHQSSSKMARASASMDLAEARVLLIDPSRVSLEEGQRALSAHGYNVELAFDKESAGAKLDRERFDVVVADAALPGMGALATMRLVRERDLDVPVVFFAERSEVPKATEAIDYGAFRLVRKPIDYEGLASIVRHATGLHRIATLKRQAIEVSGAQMHRLGDRAGLEVRFDKALSGLWLAFQPIVECTSRSVFGYEALVRSDEPALRTPLELLSAAEHLGRFHDLGRAVRARLAQDAQSAPPGAKLFVNVHPEDLADFDLFSPAAPLSTIGNRVVLEVTDRSSLHRVSNLHSRLAKLRALGFRVCVDDLGAGHAGLSSFSQLEPEFGKLDGSLVRGVQMSSRRRTVLKSMLELMGQDLGMAVICEGVETVAEKATLIELGADMLQGHLFAPPSRQFVVPTL